MFCLSRSALSCLALVATFGAVSPALAEHHKRDAQHQHKPHRAMNHEAVAQAVARQEIEYLRRHYAVATDLLGLNTPESYAEGLAIYQRIFTPNAKITAKGVGGTVFTAEGPKAWADVAQGALAVFDATQHLIGTQLVTIESLPDEQGEGGAASMSSYLQAWHSDPDRILDIYIGTYRDRVVYTPGIGWQIAEMTLEQVSGDVQPRP